MHLCFIFDACRMHSPFKFVHLTHQNLRARALFCLNSLAKVNAQLLIYKYCCGCCKLGVAVSVRWFAEGTLQLLHCAVAPFGLVAAYPVSNSNLQWPQQYCVIWDLHNRSGQSRCCQFKHKTSGWCDLADQILLLHVCGCVCVNACTSNLIQILLLE